jgi:hypothetical protein
MLKATSFDSDRNRDMPYAWGAGGKVASGTNNKGL